MACDRLERDALLLPECGIEIGVRKQGGLIDM